ncbi:hypothetical protein HZA75_03075 [Candidatus Roizmanbacteria bacterium]|nr:hypothetical protein [Candidatus Roizmanbacteria bacterium]
MNPQYLSLSVAIFAFSLAWFVFKENKKEKRLSKKSEKKDILESIKAELEFMSPWLSTSYENTTLTGQTWTPFFLVYGLSRNEACKNAISNRSVTLLSNELLAALVKFNQLSSHFEQHIQKAMMISTSDPQLAVEATRMLDTMPDDKARWKYMIALLKDYINNKPLTPVERMLVATYTANRAIHIDGIGSRNDPLSLHSIFMYLKGLVEKEAEDINQEAVWREPRWYCAVDMFFLLLLSLGIMGLMLGLGFATGLSLPTPIVALLFALLITVLLLKAINCYFSKKT